MPGIPPMGMPCTLGIPIPGIPLICMPGIIGRPIVA
jgi:hypothetical protein